MSSKVHVYVIFDRRMPIYVGMGSERRAHSHLKKTRNPYLTNVLVQCQKAGRIPTVKIVASFSTRVDAFSLERSLVKKYGRRDINTGTLCNLTDGGDGPMNGTVQSARMKKLHDDPDFALARDQRGRERFNKFWSDDTFIERQARAASEFIRRMNANPTQTMIEDRHRSGQRGKKSLAMFWNNPRQVQNLKIKNSQLMAEQWNDPEFRSKVTTAASRTIRRLNADPEFLKRNHELRVEVGKKVCRTEYTCPKCNRIGKGPNFLHHHFNNCKAGGQRVDRLCRADA